MAALWRPTGGAGRYGNPPRHPAPTLKRLFPFPCTHRCVKAVTPPTVQPRRRGRGLGSLAAARYRAKLPRRSWAYRSESAGTHAAQRRQGAAGLGIVSLSVEGGAGRRPVPAAGPGPPNRPCLDVRGLGTASLATKTGQTVSPKHAFRFT